MKFRKFAKSATLALCLPQGVALAQVTVGEARVEFVGADGGGGCTDSSGGGGLLSIGCDYTGAEGSGGGSAQALATFGHLGVSTAAGGVVAFDAGQDHRTHGAHVYSTASMQDLVTIESGGRSDEGTLNFSFYFNVKGSGSVSGKPAPEVGASLAANVYNAEAYMTVNGRSFSNGVAAGTRLDVLSDGTAIRHDDFFSYVNGVPGNALGFFEYSVPFTFGVPFTLQMELRGFAFADASGTATASMSMDAMNSFDWAGIQGVTADGAVVPFSLTSASGTDWTQSMAPAVPEPESWLLMFAGLSVLMAAVKRRRSPRA